MTQCEVIKVLRKDSGQVVNDSAARGTEEIALAGLAIEDGRDALVHLCAVVNEHIYSRSCLGQFGCGKK